MGFPLFGVDFFHGVCFILIFFKAIPTKFGILYYKCNVILLVTGILGGGYVQIFLGGEKFDRFVDFFAPNIGEMIPNLRSIFLNWIESIIHTHTLIYNDNDL